MTVKKKHKIIFISILSALAMVVLIIAIAFLWWYGCFLPRWVEWKQVSATLEDGRYVVLKNRRLTVYEDETCKKKLWTTQADWFVQDIVIKDLDRDGRAELTLLVWKHGSYGKHRPFWVKKNDIDIKQHVFIYAVDSSREKGVRAMWMSSQITYEIESISSGKKDRLEMTDREGTIREWIWKDFGLTFATERKK
ncbi:MAG: hypothetical protein J6Z22_06600 [Lachnospiraceae bacterium]|nr:hypothetical protein [Lachnospiraceae bacterium]